MRQTNLGGAYLQGALMPVYEREQAEFLKILKETPKTPEPSKTPDRGMEI
jgi:hypothetical protein